MKLLIDTNIYLDFYRSNKNSIQLLNELSKHFDNIILTDQIIQEFERNRETVIKALKKALRQNHSLRIFLVHIYKIYQSLQLYYLFKKNIKQKEKKLLQQSILY